MAKQTCTLKLYFSFSYTCSSLKQHIQAHTCSPIHNIIWILQYIHILVNVFHTYTQDPKPFPYLCHDDPYSFDIHLEVGIKGTYCCHQFVI